MHMHMTDCRGPAVLFLAVKHSYLVNCKGCVHQQQLSFQRCSESAFELPACSNIALRHAALHMHVSDVSVTEISKAVITCRALSQSPEVTT